MESKSKFTRPTHTTAAKADEADAWIRQGSEASTPAPAAESQPRPSAPKVETPVEMKRLTIDVPMSLHIRVKNGCTSRGMKMADVIRDLLEKEFPETNRRK